MDEDFQEVIGEGTEQELLYRESVRRAGIAGAIFLKNLPASVDVMGLLKLIDDYVGGDMGTEILRGLMGGHSGAIGYRIVETPTTNARLGVGSQKISAIKRIRELLGLGLKDAKDFAEGTISQDMSAEDAVTLSIALKEYGFTLISL